MRRSQAHPVAEKGMSDLHFDAVAGLKDAVLNR